MSGDVMAVDPSNLSVWELDQTFSSVLGAGREWIEAILAEMEKMGWNGRDIFAVNMALEESVTNAIEHGNNCHPDKNVRLYCKLTKDLVFISVRDEGKGFALNRVPDPLAEENIDSPSGRGVLLINGFMSKVWYNEKGNEIFMEKTASDPTEKSSC